jgi:hypothetical protein
LTALIPLPVLHSPVSVQMRPASQRSTLRLASQRSAAPGQPKEQNRLQLSTALPHRSRLA